VVFWQLPIVALGVWLAANGYQNGFGLFLVALAAVFRLLGFLEGRLMRADSGEDEM
jgi:hypothetical protein